MKEKIVVTAVDISEEDILEIRQPLNTHILDANVNFLENYRKSETTVIYSTLKLGSVFYSALQNKPTFGGFSYKIV